MIRSCKRNEFQNYLGWGDTHKSRKSENFRHHFKKVLCYEMVFILWNYIIVLSHSWWAGLGIVGQCRLLTFHYHSVA